MPIIDRPEDTYQRPLAQRLGWFAALWLGSVVTLGLVAMLIKLALKTG